MRIFVKTLKMGVCALFALALGESTVPLSPARANTKAPVMHGALTPVENPRDATFFVNGERVALRNGSAESPAVPGSASVTRTQLLGPAAYGDIDRDGDSDAVFWLAQDGGGSGTFYYVAVAHRVEGGYLGGDVLLIGDRIVPKRLDVLQDLGVVEYLERAPDQPMTAPPQSRRGAWFVVEGGRLVVAGTLGPGEEVLEGWVRFGHEVRSFEPCAEPRSYWLMGDSPALAAVEGALRSAAAGTDPWPPRLMVLAGRRTASPRDGFGTDHDAGWQVTKVLRVASEGECRGNQIVLESPVLDSEVSSPLTVRGRARGSWFFEGDFPVLLQDTDGNTLARTVASAEGQWMTSEFVPFSAVLTFESPRRRAGRLILVKDNPSDRSELDDMLVVPLFFR